jgi:hypothetical protein
VDAAALSKHLIRSPAEPSLHNGSAWINIVIDDLFQLEVPCLGGGFLKVPGMNGWMMKLNAMVTCPSPSGSEELPMEGYQILTLDFEATWGASGWVKKQGALATQKIPAFLSDFEISCGPSGSTATSSMESGTHYSAAVRRHGAGDKAGGKDQDLVLLRGTLEPLNETDQKLCEFIVNRPHKFLLQQQQPLCKDIAQDGQLAFASWKTDFDSRTTGCMHVARSNGELERMVLPILVQRLGADLTASMDLEGARCFLQPEYSMTDCKNSAVDW